MHILELKNQIMKNDLSNLYIFEGEEIGIINIYLNQISKVTGLPITRCETVVTALNSCRSGSLFGNSKGLYVVRNDKDVTKEEKNYSELNSIEAGNILILLYDKIDSRTKFSKFFKDKIVKFEKLSPSVLKSYVKKEIKLKDTNIGTLMALCNNSYDMCMLEIDKIKHYQQVTNDDPDKCFESLLAQGAIYQPEDVDVFKFTDSVCNRDAINAYRLERMLRESGSSSINLLGTLYNSLRSVMLIQLHPGAGVCEVTGLEKNQVYFNKKYINKYPIDKLVFAVKEISKAVDGVKTGKIEDMYATRYILSKIL